MVGSALAAWIAVRLAQVRDEQRLLSLAAKVSEMQARLDSQVLTTAVAHERIRGAEVLVEHTDKKLTEVDGRRHRYQTFNDEAMRELSQQGHREITELHKWVSEKLVAALTEALRHEK
jgi:hypothetical protein